MYEHKPDAHERNQEVLDHIDRAITEPPLTIEESLDHALAVGGISQEEHDDCLAAYIRAFGLSKELYPD